MDLRHRGEGTETALLAKSIPLVRVANAWRISALAWDEAVPAREGHGVVREPSPARARGSRLRPSLMARGQVGVVGPEARSHSCQVSGPGGVDSSVSSSLRLGVPSSGDT